MSVKVSSEQCPECKQKEKETLEIQERARQKNANAIQFWYDQSENMKQKIEVGDDEEVKKELGKMLKRCNTLWVGKVKEAELDAGNQSSAHPVMGKALKKHLEDVEGKIKLNMEAAEHFRDREDHRIVENEDEVDDSHELALLNTNCKEWEDLLASIKILKEDYEEHIIQGFGCGGKAWRNLQGCHPFGGEILTDLGASEVVKAARCALVREETKFLHP
jgi:hypothetical protein